MKRFTTLLAVIISCYAHSEFAVLGDPLKDRYEQGDYLALVSTGEKSDSYSYTCDMGEAVPIEDKEGWYNNRPVYGLKLELSAKAVIDMKASKVAAGFVSMVKNNTVLKTFKPLSIQVFSHWTMTDTDEEIGLGQYSLGHGKLIQFDILDGKGFYYRDATEDDSPPDYFLSRCTKVKKTDLPVYIYQDAVE